MQSKSGIIQVGIDTCSARIRYAASCGLLAASMVVITPRFLSCDLLPDVAAMVRNCLMTCEDRQAQSCREEGSVDLRLVVVESQERSESVDQLRHAAGAHSRHWRHDTARQPRAHNHEDRSRGAS